MAVLAENPTTTPSRCGKAPNTVNDTAGADERRRDRPHRVGEFVAPAELELGRAFSQGRASPDKVFSRDNQAGTSRIRACGIVVAVSREPGVGVHGAHLPIFLPRHCIPRHDRDRVADRRSAVGQQLNDIASKRALRALGASYMFD